MLANKSITSLGSVLDVAVWLEKHGQEFYQKAEKEAADAETRELFTSLAVEEGKHCAIYTDLYNLYTGKSAENEQLLGEYGRFIQLLIKEISKALQFEGELNPLELVDRALKFEKNTLIFFNEVKPLFTGKAEVMVASVCAEEKRHIEKLMELRATLEG